MKQLFKNYFKTSFKTSLDFLVYVIVRVLFCFVQALSLEAGQRLARRLAWFFTTVLPIRRRLLDENLQQAFPEKGLEERKRIARAMWEHLFLMGIEIAHSGRQIQDFNWREHFQLHGALPLLSLLHQDRPLIMVTGHFGNFEMGGFALGILNYPSNSVARSLDNPFLNRFIKNFRESTGQFLIEKNGGSNDILRVLENRGLMAFLADQSAGPKGCMVDFFGRKASTYKAIGLLAMQFKAPIAVCYCLRRNNEPLHFDIHVSGYLDPENLPPEIQNVKDITQWYTKKLEDGIRLCPEQYWWVHRRWKY